jgi:DNA-binding transcriptional MerR regulator
VDVALKYRETLFSPSEAALITGLSLHLQRDWRSQGLLRAREGGRASFTPRELAEMRVMVRLRSLGLPLPEVRPVAEQAAPSVIFMALADHPDLTLNAEGSDEEARRYMDALNRATDSQYLLTLAEVASRNDVYRNAIVADGACELEHALHEDVLEESTEVAGVVNLWAVARAIAKATPRPLFTLVPPRN